MLQSSRDLVTAAEKGDLTAVTALLARSNVDKNYQNEVSVFVSSL